MLKTLKRLKGDYYEQKAHDFLRQKGYHCIARNYQVHCGEIDLIVVKEDMLIFVEVRSKANDDFGLAFESVNRCKQLKIKKTASYFLLQHPFYRQFYCRYDVISFTASKMDWIQHAFV